MAGDSTLTADTQPRVPPSGAALVVVEVLLRTGPVVVAGETSAVPGLVITPTVAGETSAVPGLVITPTVAGTPARFTGGWQLTHQASGLLVVPGLSDTPLMYVREAIEALRAAPVDWTAPARQVQTNQLARDAAGRVTAMVLTALVEHEPLWWATDSLCQADAGWSLRCAAPLCRADLPGDQPEWLTEHDEDDGVSYRVRVSDPDRLTAPATQAGWRRHGTHWLCPPCADAHPLSHQDHLEGC